MQLFYCPRLLVSPPLKRLAKRANDALLKAGHTTIKTPSYDCEALAVWDVARHRGAAILTFFRDEESSSIYIQVVWVDPRYRGRGLFSLMVRALKSIARRRKVKLVCVEVSSKNKNMQDLMAAHWPVSYVIYTIPTGSSRGS